MGRWLLSGIILIVLIIGGYLPLSITWRETRVPQSNSPFGGRFVKTSDGIFFSQILGYPEQPTVVLLHGAGAWSETWKPTMRMLAREGYRAVALDLPPFGISFAPSKNYSRTAQAQRIKDAIDNLRIRNLILVVHGESAPAGLTAAQMLGERVKGLVIVAGSFGWPQVEGQPDKPLPAQFDKALNYKTARQWMASFATHNWVYPQLLKKLVYNPSSITKQVAMVYTTPFGYRGTNSKMAEWLRQYFHSTNNTMKVDAGFFQYFKMPTLLVWGNFDKVSPGWQARKLREFMPQSELLLMPKVGHIPHLENEKAFNEALLHFIVPLAKPVKLVN